MQDTAENKGRRIAFNGTAEYRKRLKAAALARDLSVQEMLEAAVEDYLSDEARSQASAPRAHGLTERIAGTRKV